MGFIISDSQSLYFMGFLFGLIVFCVIVFIYGFLASCVIVSIAVFVTFIMSDKGQKTFNCVRSALSAMAFCLSICICYIISHFVVCTGVTDYGFGDYRFVQLSSDYSLSQIDCGDFYVEDISGLYLFSVEKVVEKENILYGKNTNGEFFAVDYSKDYKDEDGMLADSINAEYVDVSTFYQSKSGEVTKGGYSVAYWICFLVGISSAIGMFHLSKVMVDFTQNIARRIRKRL